MGDLPAALGLEVAVLVEGRTAEVHTEIGDDDLILELPDAGGGAVVVDVDLGVMAGMARQELVATHVLVQERDDAGEVIEAVLAIGIGRSAVVGHDLVKVVEPVLVDHAQVGVLGAFDEFELDEQIGGDGQLLSHGSMVSYVVNGSDS